MSSIKDIKHRIANVSTTKQIMKAMDMVSVTKLQKARLRLEGVRPLSHELQSLIDDLSNYESIGRNAFTEQREVKNSAYIVVTSDKGLCGGYNVNIAKAALEHMNQGKNEQILVIGAKGSEYFKRRDKNILRRITDVSEAQIYEGSGRLSEFITSLYLKGEIDEVFVAYTHFESTLNYVPRVEKVLPISRGAEYGKTDSAKKYEPDADTFLNHIMPLYLHTLFFALFSESLACEHAARMINMESASKNASEIIDDLNSMYNRKRQAAITQELNEIVSGANILK
ncbi:MAG: ATP synthase F1 subunit gamma [Clostridiales bacterium]|nr:ATP synthase F1 subunit gamma [Clostridiales bacterium]